MTKVLILWTDEQRADSLAVGGDRLDLMPRCNAFAAGATAFTRAYCAQPVCTPSRASLITGRYPHQHGCIENNQPLAAEQPTLAELLGDAVHCGYNGKWHLGDEIFPQRGFVEWVSTEDGYDQYFSPDRDRAARSDYHQQLLRRGYRPGLREQFSRSFACMLPEADSKPAFQATQAIDFIQRHAERPWLLSVNLLEPHMPFHSCRDGQWLPAQVGLPDNHLAVPGEDCLMRNRVLAARCADPGDPWHWLAVDDGWRRCRANYAGLCGLVDSQFGRILDALAASGQFDETLIIMTSDHGDQMGSHQQIAKCVPFEESIRVPLLVKLPGQRQGRVVEQPVSLIDLLPTIGSVLDHPLPALPGRDLSPLCRGDAAPSRDVVVEWNGSAGSFTPEQLARPAYAALGDPARVAQRMAAASRTLLGPDGWKLTLSAAGERECYHLPSDPGEIRNLAWQPAHAGRIRELHARLLAWQQAEGDPVALPLDKGSASLRVGPC
jgi:arylsulfatase A-like enzyme